ncbi:MAG: HD domain-containing phosphohydrolase [Syntrophobacteraceae bacterium]
MAEKILFVDDDPNVLAGFQRQLRKLFSVETAQGGAQAVEAIAQRGPFAIIVSDLRMPEMDGIQLLSRARTLAPDSVRMMLTGNADLHAAIEAVNEGNIFRFLTKPCTPESLISALTAGLEQHRLILAERELLEKTLRGSIKVLSDVLALLNPEAFGRGTRITRYVKEVAVQMKAPGLWQLETAATLSQIGCIILSEEAIQKLYQGKPLTGEESQLFNMHPFIASDLLVNIPRMREIAEIIAYQEKHFDGTGIPNEPRSGREIPLGARILKVVLDFDTLEAGGLPRGDILLEMKKRTGSYDPSVLAALREVITAEEGYETMYVTAARLINGMILAQDVMTVDGRLLITRGYTVNRTLRERLKGFAQQPGIKEPIRVQVPVSLNRQS